MVEILILVPRSVGMKKDLYGKNRLAVGGPNPDGASAGGRKLDSALEPVFYHSGPYSLMDELVMSHAIGAINDLSPGPAAVIVS